MEEILENSLQFILSRTEKKSDTTNYSRENTIASSESLKKIQWALDNILDAALIKNSLLAEVNALREAADQHFGPQPEAVESDLHRLMHELPVNMVEATVQLGLRLVTNKRLQANWYKDRLIILINAEKSGSTLHEIVIRDIQLHILKQEANFGIQRGLRYGPTEPAYGTFHGLIPLFAPDGGILRGPFLGHAGNIRFVKELGAKVTFLCRHPADRLVARGCMTGDFFGLTTSKEDVDSGEVFSKLINEHALPQSLSTELHWMVDWLEGLGHSERFHIMRYEDMMKDAKAHFEKLHKFITNAPMSDETWLAIQSNMSRTSGGDLQPGNREERHYPKGYSGNIGVWRDYLSKDQITAYNDCVKRFVDYHPHSDILFTVYPDIYIE
ncbi:MAG: sulfotransferase domain-containing protein [Pseudomonadota bacterium]